LISDLLTLTGLAPVTGEQKKEKQIKPTNQHKNKDRESEGTDNERKKWDCELGESKNMCVCVVYVCVYSVALLTDSFSNTGSTFSKSTTSPAAIPSGLPGL